MITSEFGGDRTRTIFHHNGDFSGDVIVVRNSDEMHMALSHASNTIEVTVPYEHLEALVLERLRSRVMQQLEEASYEELRAILLFR